MIGAVKSGKIVFDGHKRVFYKDEKGDNFVAFVSGYDEITTDPGNSDEITKKLQSWAKRKGFKINKGIGAVKKLSVLETVKANINRYSLRDDPYDVAYSIGKKNNFSMKQIEQAERIIRKNYIK